jgi:translation elongation factor EF-Ts
LKISAQQLQTYDEEKLKDIIKEAVRDVLEDELMKMRLLLAPYISDEEQKEIEESYGEPSKEVVRALRLEE